MTTSRYIWLNAKNIYLGHLNFKCHCLFAFFISKCIHPFTLFYFLFPHIYGACHSQVCQWLFCESLFENIIQNNDINLTNWWKNDSYIMIWALCVHVNCFETKHLTTAVTMTVQSSVMILSCRNTSNWWSFTQIDAFQVENDNEHLSLGHYQPIHNPNHTVPNAIS